MSNRPSLDDYVDVAERIQDFKDAHEHGSLQTLGWEVVTVEGYDRKASAPVKTTFIVYRAAAFRTPDDPTPGQGIAWEPFPGGTPYTKDSELMNAETAAWGRAIIALGLVANRSLASRQEIRNRRADQDAEADAAKVETAKGAAEPKPHPSAVAAQAAAKAETPPAERKPAPRDASLVGEGELDQLRATYTASGLKDHELCWMLVSVGVESLPERPSKADIGTAMKGLTPEQAFNLEELLKGEDGATPGSGEAK